MPVLPEAPFLHPFFKGGNGPQLHGLADRGDVVVAGGLVVEHHVVPVGYAHEIVAARRRQQHRQVFVVVLVGPHVVGIAAVAAHGQAVELAHEVVLQARADELAVVVQVFRRTFENRVCQPFLRNADSDA